MAWYGFGMNVVKRRQLGRTKRQPSDGWQPTNGKTLLSFGYILWDVTNFNHIALYLLDTWMLAIYIYIYI